MEIRELVQRIRRKIVPDHPDPRTTPCTKIALRQFYNYYADRAAKGIPPNLMETGFRVFAQFEEDGILLAIFATIGMKSRKFVDIGSADGINSNCANLALNFGWDGLFIDADPENVSRGQKFYSKHPDSWCRPPTFITAKILRENVNEIISDAGFAGEVDLISIDIDGNDYWIWDAITAVVPRVVIIETHIELGYDSIVVPYDPRYHYPPEEHPGYFGASAPAMKKLAEKKGYRLVASNNYGFNTIYVRADECGDLLTEITIDQVLSHPHTKTLMKQYDAIKDLDFIQV